MKKYILILFVSFFISSCFINKNNESIINNTKTGIIIKEENSKSWVIDNNTLLNQKKIKENYVSCEDLLKDDKKNNVNKKILWIYDEFYKIRSNYIWKNKEFDNEIKYEYNIVQSFYYNKCDDILKFDAKDDYTFELCNIYISKDLSKLDNFKFNPGDTKEEAKATFNSLYKWKLLPWASKSTFNSIYFFNENKKNIKFSFKNEDWFRWDYYIYYKENWEEKFLKELNKQFLLECKKIEDEN